jgi:hypothetical protein
MMGKLFAAVAEHDRVWLSDFAVLQQYLVP